MRSWKAVGFTALMLCVAAPRAWGQGGQVTEKKTITLEGAKDVAAAAASEALRNIEGGSIAVVDDGYNLVYVERLEQTYADSAEISIHNARTEAMFRLLS